MEEIHLSESNQQTSFKHNMNTYKCLRFHKKGSIVTDSFGRALSTNRLTVLTVEAIVGGHIPLHIHTELSPRHNIPRDPLKVKYHVHVENVA